MPTRIPQNRQWTQLNQGDIFGSLFSTRNIDLTVPGVLKLARRTSYVGQSTTSFGDLLHAIYAGEIYGVLTSDKIFLMNDDLTGFAVDAVSGTPTLFSGSDGVQEGRSRIYVSKTARVDKSLQWAAWTTSFSTSDFSNTDGTIPHPLELNVTNGNLLAGDGGTLRTIDLSSGAMASGIVVQRNHTIAWIRQGNGVNYIGCYGNRAGMGAVYIWDGLATSTGYNRIIQLDTPFPLSGAIDDAGNLYIMTLDGRLQVFNGSGFTTVAELPPVKDFYARTSWGDSTGAKLPMRQRGLSVIKGKIYACLSTGLADAGVNNQFMIPNFQGGVWCYDKELKSFYHMYAPSNSNTDTDFGQSYGSSMASAVVPYYVNLPDLNNDEASVDVGGVLLSGGTLQPATIAGTALGTVVSVTTGENRGSFVTTKIESPQATDKAVAVWCKFRGLETATDKILFKYRTTFRKPVAIGNGVTWNSTTQFVTISTNDATKMSTVAVGDEVTVLSGNGAGCSAHITVISENAGLYTVTLDEAITGVSSTNTGYVMIENWKKHKTTITYANTDGYERFAFDVGAARWFQIKVELRGEGGVVGIEELDLIAPVHKPLT